MVQNLLVRQKLSAIGAVSEDASILGKTLIFVGMAEGIAIYGMIISILILFV